MKIYTKNKNKNAQNEGENTKPSQYVTEKVSTLWMEHYREGIWTFVDFCSVYTSFSETVCIFGHVSL